MTRDMIEADLMLRGWVAYDGLIAKHRGPMDHMWITGNAGSHKEFSTRVHEMHLSWPASLKPLEYKVFDLESLRCMHDIVCKYERGHYDKGPDGGSPNIARVESQGAPERCGIQTAQSEYGGVPRYRGRRSRL